jgi:hypothetical protein
MKPQLLRWSSDNQDRRGLSICDRRSIGVRHAELRGKTLERAPAAGHCSFGSVTGKCKRSVKGP